MKKKLALRLIPRSVHLFHNNDGFNVPLLLTANEPKPNSGAIQRIFTVDFILFP